MEIFVCDDGFDAFIIHIGRRIRPCQNEFGVENIQALVFHRPHIEVRHRDDIEQIQIVFEAIDLLVPLHGPFQAVHRIVTAILVAMFDKDTQRHITARHGLETVFDTGQITGHQRKQVGRLGERIFPHREMTPAIKITTVDQVAV